MKRSPFRPVVLAYVVVACGCAHLGCASPRDAVRPAALIVVDQMNAYERELDAQIAAEDAYYRGLTTLLADNARRVVLLEQANASIAAADQFADQILLESNGVPVSRLIAFLRDTDDRFNAIVTAQMQEEAAARTRAAAVFAKAGYQREMLAGARASLLELIRPLSVSEQVESWIAYGRRVKKEIDALNKAATQPSTQPAPP